MPKQKQPQPQLLPGGISPNLSHPFTSMAEITPVASYVWFQIVGIVGSYGMHDKMDSGRKMAQNMHFINKIFRILVMQETCTCACWFIKQLHQSGRAWERPKVCFLFQLALHFFYYNLLVCVQRFKIIAWPCLIYWNSLVCFLLVCINRQGPRLREKLKNYIEQCITCLKFLLYSYFCSSRLFVLITYFFWNGVINCSS